MENQYVQQYESLEKYHWWWITRRQIVLSILKKLSKRFENPHRLLDVGCGAGMQLSVLTDFQAIGLEPDPYLAGRARINAKTEIINQSLPLDSSSMKESFQFILLLDVLEHLEDPLGALQSMLEYLKPSGYVVINVPAHPWLWSVHDEVNQHKRRYTKKELHQLTDNAGLSVEEIQYWGSFLVPAAFLRRKNSVANEYQVSIPSPVVSGILTRLLMLDFSFNKHFVSFTGLSLLAVAQKKAQ